MYFEWSDGTPVTYTRWLRGEPTHANNRQEDCVVMKGKVKSCLAIDLIILFNLSFGTFSMQEYKSGGCCCLKQPILDSFSCYFLDESSLFKVAKSFPLLLLSEASGGFISR